MKKFNQSLLATAMLLAAGGANAAAFQLAEVSTSGLGRAYAGEAAIADNASVVATNPALMSLFKTAQFSTGGVYIDSRINMSGDVTASIKNSSTSTTKDDAASARNVVPGAFCQIFISLRQ
ncbi:Outer membrane protein P1 precursor [Haemophilus influenzae]|nr:Outer membrane protein P1 precursor [Haemophilus influenzae]PRM35795.1 Outer membrane protein P1 precursor [Haemophilus influenzae]